MDDRTETTVSMAVGIGRLTATALGLAPLEPPPGMQLGGPLCQWRLALRSRTLSRKWRRRRITPMADFEFRRVFEMGSVG